MSITRVGLSESQQFAEGYDAIFGKKKPATQKPAAKKPAPKKAAAKKKPATKKK